MHFRFACYRNPNHNAALAPWLHLRGGVQYVIRPAGRIDIPNALVFDLKTVVRF